MGSTIIRRADRFCRKIRFTSHFAGVADGFLKQRKSTSVARIKGIQGFRREDSVSVGNRYRGLLAVGRFEGSKKMIRKRDLSRIFRTIATSSGL